MPLCNRNDLTNFVTVIGGRLIRACEPHAAFTEKRHFIDFLTMREHLHAQNAKVIVIVKCRLIPKGICVNIFGTIWTRDPSWIDRHVINHEKIHTAQQRELLFVPFYLLYVIEWLFRLVQYRKFEDAYMNISFEREAYAHGHDLNYLPRRKPYAWVRCLTRKINA